MMRAHPFLRDQRGASAAEFALVLPLFLLLLLGILDSGRLLWELNQIKKATQVGARMAIVTDPVDGSLATESYVGHDPGSGILFQGDVIPASALGRITCDDTTCTCQTSPCKGSRSHDADAFNNVVGRMSAHYPLITAENVTISYLGSGLGFAGDPTGPDLSPTVEVEVTGLVFQPAASFLLASFNMPAVRTSMTAEDQAGAASN